MPSADLLLHPLRLRIVQTFLGDRQLTTGQLLAEIDGIPPATLYRQVATLAKAGVLTVVGERQVRGTVERTYALSVAGRPDHRRGPARHDAGGSPARVHGLPGRIAGGRRPLHRRR